MQNSLWHKEGFSVGFYFITLMRLQNSYDDSVYYSTVSIGLLPLSSQSILCTEGLEGSSFCFPSLLPLTLPPSTHTHTHTSLLP